MTPSLEAAREYLNRGLMPLPVREGKNPNFKDWQKFTTTESDLPRYFSNGGNVGLLLGAPSRGLVDVDCDWPEASRLAGQFLPLTKMISGRAHSPRSHYWYLAPGAKTVKFQDPDIEDEKRAMIVELRSTGAQTLVAPSRHPEGDVYEWAGPLEPGDAKPAELLAAVKRLAAASLLARRWRDGRRHELALALAGMLFRAGWSAERIERFVLSVAEAAGDAELPDRQKAIANTVRKIGAGEPATGTPTLVSLIGEKVVGRLRDWLDLPRGSSDGFDGALPGRVQKSPDDWPDPKPIPQGLLSVPALDEGMLPEVLRSWLVDIAERLQCPLEFPAASAIVSIASVIGNQLAIRPKRQDDWTVVPNLWGAAIGRPGVMKSPAIAEPMKPLFRLVKEAEEDYKARYREWQFEREIAEAQRKAVRARIEKAAKKGDDLESFKGEYQDIDEPEEPHERRYVVNDTTIEKYGELLNQNPQGLLIFRDELTGWLRSLERDERKEDRAFFLEAWNGYGSYTYDRIGRGTIKIKSITTSILGGIQPGPLESYLRGALGRAESRNDDGLLQRFQMIVYPDVSREWRDVDRWPDTAAKNRAFAIYQRLSVIESTDFRAIRDEDDENAPPFLRFSESAQELFGDWRSDLEYRLRSGAEDHPALEAHFAKYRKLFPTLALIFHLVDVASGDTPGPVSLESAELAARWCAFLEAHARRIYGLGYSSAAIHARTLARHLINGDLTSPFTARDVYLKGWAGLSSAADVADPLDLLSSLGWLDAVEIRREVGRPTVHFLINPKLAQFASGGTLRNSESTQAGYLQNLQKPGEKSEKPTGTVPTKPTKPHFDGFEGTVPEHIQNSHPGEPVGDEEDF